MNDSLGPNISSGSKKILLIQPPFYRFIGMRTRYFPYHLVCLATQLCANGHNAMVLDAEATEKTGSLDFTDMEARYGAYLSGVSSLDHPIWKVLGASVAAFKPDYIGITIWTTFIASAMRTAEICRRVCPEAKIIAGGPHVTLLPEDIIRADVFDIAVVGEGEQTLCEIVQGRELNEIKGIAYRAVDGWQRTEPRAFTNNLDEYGIPRRDLLMDEGAYDREDMGLIMTSRGCPYSCAYCATSLWRQTLRSRSVDNVLDEMSMVNKKYGTRYFALKDDVLTVNKKWLAEFCQKLPRILPRVFWECNAHLRTIDTDMLCTMRKAGCLSVKVGVESGSDRVHRLINKGLTNGLIRSKMKELRSSGMHVTCYFMMGIPGETHEDVEATIELARRIKPDYLSMSVYEIFPGTKLHAAGVADGSALSRMAFEDYFRIAPHHYYFARQRRGLSGMNDDEYDLLETRVKKFANRYNRSPRAIYRRLRSRVPLYVANPRQLLHDARQFVSWI
jgi:anaerobic magnesium-protoporphyrin IX monomethyl ester cyclase